VQPFASRGTLSATITLVFLLAADIAFGQQGPPEIPQFALQAYPQREVDPAAVERGRALYTVYGCAFCHGEDTRGGNGGPSLLRAESVLLDERGETIAPVILNGVSNTAMVGFALEPHEIADIAEFLHSFTLNGYDPARVRPETIVTGNPRAGRRYFDARCSECHSVDGDLAGIASRFPDPRTLQQNWLMPRNGRPVIAAVSLPDGPRFEGTVAQIDEFLITIRMADGTRRSFARRGDVPAVVLADPLAPHKALLPVYADGDIHNVTAYLATIE
jgi:cytochrome c oxidase cbb3-type subunit 3